MLVTLKGNPTQVQIGVTVPIGIASYPDNVDNPVQEHKIHFFVLYSGAWAEISLKTYNALAAAGNPVGNADARKVLTAAGFAYPYNGAYEFLREHNGHPAFVNYTNVSGRYLYYSAYFGGYLLGESLYSEDPELASYFRSPNPDGLWAGHYFQSVTVTAAGTVTGDYP